jgi:hypothetical protein
MAVEKVEIEVTQADIDHGVRDSCESCPIALALNRACPGRGPATVDTDSFYFDWFSEVYMLTREAQKFIKKFDDGDPVGPISFDVFVESNYG